MKQKEKNQLDLELREDIIECADMIIEDITDSGMIMNVIQGYWNDELDVDEAVEIAEKVYQQIKLRM